MENKVNFRICPAFGKYRYYDKLSSLLNDFSLSELSGCSISIVINAMVVMYFTDEQIAALLNELYQGQMNNGKMP